MSHPSGLGQCGKIDKIQASAQFLKTIKINNWKLLEIVSAIPSHCNIIFFCIKKTFGTLIQELKKRQINLQILDPIDSSQAHTTWATQTHEFKICTPIRSKKEGLKNDNVAVDWVSKLFYEQFSTFFLNLSRIEAMPELHFFKSLKN